MNIKEFRSMFPDEEVCRQYLERTIWHQGRICPHCKCLHSWLLSGPSVRKGLYECAECGRPLIGRVERRRAVSIFRQSREYFVPILPLPVTHRMCSRS